MLVEAWLETAEVRKYAQTIREDLDNLLTKAVQLRSVVEKRTADNANESDVAASSEPRRKVLKRNEAEGLEEEGCHSEQPAREDLHA